MTGRPDVGNRACDGRSRRFVEARRSIRAFTAEPVDPSELDTLVTAACLAPAPHHSRPWRFVIVTTEAAKAELADGMGRRWRTISAPTGSTRTASTHSSRRRGRSSSARRRSCSAASPGTASTATPTRLDERAEWGMALLSLGAAVENLMLAAADRGLASCWVAAPIFCPDAARDALALPNDWLPHAMVLVGHPDPAYVGRPRPEVPLDVLRATR